MSNYSSIPIYMTREVYSSILSVLASKEFRSTEFMWLSKVKKEDKFFKVESFEIVPQYRNSGVFCATDPSRYPEFLHEMGSEVSRLRFHGHSHHSMDVTPSSIDIKNMKEILEDIEDYFIEFIINNRLEFTLRIHSSKERCTYKVPTLFICDDEEKPIARWESGSNMVLLYTPSEDIKNKVLEASRINRRELNHESK